jgi:2-dehydropantoate 2-reductase
MKILVIGMGAIGGYLGGKLSISGQEVTFLVRDTAKYAGKAIRIQRGNAVEVIEKPVVVSKFTNHQLSETDLILLTTKAYQVIDATSFLLGKSGSIPPILCLTNGVGIEEALIDRLGDESIVYGTITTAVSKNNSGALIVEKERGVAFGSGPATPPLLYEILIGAGILAEELPNGPALKWSKLLLNQFGNATSAILNMTTAEIFNHPALFSLEMEQARETLAVMAAMDLEVTDLPGMPVKLLAGVIGLPILLAHPLLENAVAKGRGDKMPSLNLDLYSGAADSEVRYLHGAVAAHGEKLGVETPVNRFLTETLLSLVEKKKPLDTYRHDPEKLLADYEQEKIN